MKCDYWIGYIDKIDGDLYQISGIDYAAGYYL